MYKYKIKHKKVPFGKRFLWERGVVDKRETFRANEKLCK